MQILKLQKEWIGKMIKLHIKRKAVAMIELIFAIVIMGIALMSAPTLISQASQGSLTVVQQEAIVAGATEIGMIMTRAWDEADTDDTNYNPILVTVENNTVPKLAEVIGIDGNGTGKRVGIPQPSSRSFLTSDGQRLNASAIQADGGDLDDIDDFDGRVTILGVQAVADATNTEDGDYIDTSLQIATNVSYNTSPNIAYTAETISFNSPFNPAANSANIKSIITRVTSSSHDAELHTDITLRAFMCNIGSYELNRRTF
jgi:hypothetical protein